MPRDVSRSAEHRPAAPNQAVYHRRTRKAHASETAEDYVEAIADLTEAAGSDGARVVDLARCLGVSHVTVVRTIARLGRDGYVDTKPYKAVRLTPAGKKLAKAARARHEIVMRFLLALGVDADTARADSEGIEHHVSAKTLKMMAKFADENG